MKRILSTVKSVGNAQSVGGAQDEIEWRVDVRPVLNLHLKENPVAARHLDIGPLHRRDQNRLVGDGVEQVHLQLVTAPDVPTVGVHVEGEGDVFDTRGNVERLLNGGLRVTVAAQTNRPLTTIGQPWRRVVNEEVGRAAAPARSKTTCKGSIAPKSTDSPWRVTSTNRHRLSARIASLLGINGLSGWVIEG